MERVDAVVVGAGVVGLAIARALALPGREVVVVEREARFGTATSSRNSEVIHAGLYYPPGSLKARLCIAGRDRLYAYCAERQVRHARMGKLIFARDEAQVPGLEAIERNAAAAGAGGLRRLDRRETAMVEPELDACQALHSSMTGIVDSHGLMTALLADAEAAGALLARGSEVDRLTRAAGGWRIHVAGTAAVEAPIVINAAGLGAQALAAATEGLPAERVPPLFLARGVYFGYSGRVPFRHLVYPLPEPGGLGTHLTLDLAGSARFGPDVEWIDRVDYSVDPARKPAFAAAARRIWPALDPDRLHPAYAGIRPKLVGPGEAAADFMISGPDDHGLSGLVNLFGIESPGLTACLALADLVAERLG